jgi:hypothetical protein
MHLKVVGSMVTRLGLVFVGLIKHDCRTSFCCLKFNMYLLMLSKLCSFTYILPYVTVFLTAHMDLNDHPSHSCNKICLPHQLHIHLY